MNAEKNHAFLSRKKILSALVVAVMLLGFTGNAVGTWSLNNDAALEFEFGESTYENVVQYNDTRYYGLTYDDWDSTGAYITKLHLDLDSRNITNVQAYNNLPVIDSDDAAAAASSISVQDGGDYLGFSTDRYVGMWNVQTESVEWQVERQDYAGTVNERVQMDSEGNMWAVNEKGNFTKWDTSGNLLKTFSFAYSSSPGSIEFIKNESMLFLTGSAGNGALGAKLSGARIIDISNESINSSITSASEIGGGIQWSSADYHSKREVVVLGTTNDDGSNASNNCLGVYEAFTENRIYSQCGSTVKGGSEVEDNNLDTEINEDTNSVYFTYPDKFTSHSEEIVTFDLESDNTMTRLDSGNLQWGSKTPIGFHKIESYSYPSYVVGSGLEVRYGKFAGFIVLDSPPTISNIGTTPSSPTDGELVSFEAEVFSPADTVTNVSANVYEENTLINSSVPMNDSDEDNFYNASEVFTTNNANYTIEVSGTDTQNRTSSKNYTFEAVNLPPSVDNIDYSPSSPVKNDLLNISANVSDPENDVSTVSYNLLEAGSSVASGSMIDTGNQWEANDIYNLTGAETYTVEVTVTDGNGNSATDSVQFNSGDPPSFNFVRPDDDRLFLTSTDVDVQFEYGGETQEDGDWILLVNGFVEDTTGDLAGSNTEGVHTITYTPPVEAVWELQFDSTTTGNTYTSDIFRTFYVRESPVNVKLETPGSGATFNVDFGESTTVDFNWTEDSKGFNETYNSVFELRNDSSNNIIDSSTDQDVQPDQLRYDQFTSELLPKGQYTWIVSATDGSGTTYETEQRTFSLEEPATFTQKIEEPLDGTTFTIPLDEETRDVNVSYTISPNTEDVQSELLLDDNSISTQTTSTTQGNTTYNNTLQSVGTGSHTVKVESQDAVGNTETTTSGFSIEKTGLFDIFIDNPSEGDTYRTPVDSNTRDVNASFTVDVGSVNVTTTASLNGNQIDQRTFDEHGTTQPFNLTLENLSEQQHTIEFSAEDTVNNTDSKTVNFEVAPDDEPPEIVEFRSTPNLRDANAGDSLDLYFEGLEGSDEIDYVNVSIFVEGEVQKYEVIPAEELVEGSFLKSLTDWFTITSDILGKSVEIKVEAFDTAGRSALQTLFGTAGETRDPAVTPIAPGDGETIPQTDGDVEPVKFEFDVKTNQNSNYYNFWIKPDYNDVYTLVENVEVPENDTTESFERFININDTFSSDIQFGTFNWYVEVYDAEQDEHFRHPTQTFSIVNDTGQPILNVDNPDNNDVLYADRDTELRDVTLDWEIDTPEAGTIKTYLDGQPFPEVSVDSGTTPDSRIERLGLGGHTWKVKFESENYNLTETREFGVELPPPPGNFIELRDPKDGESVYQDVGDRFSYTMNANSTGNTTLYIQDGSGNIVRRFTEDYVKQGDQVVYGANFNASENIGNYKWWAEATLDTEPDLRTLNRSFTIEDKNVPSLPSLASPVNNTVVGENEAVNFSLSSQAFDDPVQTVVEYRSLDSSQFTSIANVSQEANTEDTIEASLENLEPGTYAWRVRWEVNPTFTSGTYFFTVESTTVQPPNFDLTNPAQNDSYLVPENETVANVTFDFTAEVFSESGSTVELLTSRRDFDLTNYTTQSTYNLDSADGTTALSEELQLEPDGYLWKVRATYPNGTSYESDAVGFSVGENETAPQPSEEEDVTGENFLTGLFVTASSFTAGAFAGLGSTALFIAASLITGLVGIMASRWTDHVEIGILSIVVSALTFVYLGWFQAWVGVILFLIASAVFIFALRKTHGGM